MTTPPPDPHAGNGSDAAPLPMAQADPKGLIREAFRIEGITPAECRSIFVDWALSLAPGTDPGRALQSLLAAHDHPDHPMTAVLAEGLADPPTPRRRGGRAGRLG